MPEGEKIGSAYVEVQADVTEASGGLDELIRKATELRGILDGVKVGAGPQSNPQNLRSENPAASTRQGPSAEAGSSGRSAGSFDMQVNAKKIGDQIQTELSGRVFSINVKIGNLQQLTEDLQGISVTVQGKPGTTTTAPAGGATASVAASDRAFSNATHEAARKAIGGLTAVGGSFEAVASNLTRQVRATSGKEVLFQGAAGGADAKPGSQAARAFSEAKTSFLAEVVESLGMTGGTAGEANAVLRGALTGTGMNKGAVALNMQNLGVSRGKPGPLATFAAGYTPPAAAATPTVAPATPKPVHVPRETVAAQRADQGRVKEAETLGQERGRLLGTVDIPTQRDEYGNVTSPGTRRPAKVRGLPLLPRPRPLGEVDNFEHIGIKLGRDRSEELMQIGDDEERAIAADTLQRGQQKRRRARSGTATGAAGGTSRGPGGSRNVTPKGSNRDAKENQLGNLPGVVAGNIRIEDLRREMEKGTFDDLGVVVGGAPDEFVTVPRYDQLNTLDDNGKEQAGALTIKPGRVDSMQVADRFSGKTETKQVQGVSVREGMKRWLQGNFSENPDVMGQIDDLFEGRSDTEAQPEGKIWGDLSRAIDRRQESREFTKIPRHTTGFGAPSPLGMLTSGSSSLSQHAREVVAAQGVSSATPILVGPQGGLMGPGGDLELAGGIRPVRPPLGAGPEEMAAYDAAVNNRDEGALKAAEEKDNRDNRLARATEQYFKTDVDPDTGLLYNDQLGIGEEGPQRGTGTQETVQGARRTQRAKADLQGTHGISSGEENSLWKVMQQWDDMVQSGTAPTHVPEGGEVGYFEEGQSFGTGPNGTSVNPGQGLLNYMLQSELRKPGGALERGEVENAPITLGQTLRFMRSGSPAFRDAFAAGPQAALGIGSERQRIIDNEISKGVGADKRNNTGRGFGAAFEGRFTDAAGRKTDYSPVDELYGADADVFDRQGRVKPFTEQPPNAEQAVQNKINARAGVAAKRAAYKRHGLVNADKTLADPRATTLTYPRGATGPVYTARTSLEEQEEIKAEIATDTVRRAETMSTKNIAYAGSLTKARETDAAYQGRQTAHGTRARRAQDIREQTYRKADSLMGVHGKTASLTDEQIISDVMADESIPSDMRERVGQNILSQVSAGTRSQETEYGAYTDSMPVGGIGPRRQEVRERTVVGEGGVNRSLISAFGNMAPTRTDTTPHQDRPAGRQPRHTMPNEEHARRHRAFRVQKDRYGENPTYEEGGIIISRKSASSAKGISTGDEDSEKARLAIGAVPFAKASAARDLAASKAGVDPELLSGGVMQVFVTNWPPGFDGGQTASAAGGGGGGKRPTKDGAEPSEPEETPEETEARLNSKGHAVKELLKTRKGEKELERAELARLEEAFGGGPEGGDVFTEAGMALGVQSEKTRLRQEKQEATQAQGREKSRAVRQKAADAETANPFGIAARTSARMEEEFLGEGGYGPLSLEQMAQRPTMQGDIRTEDQAAVNEDRSIRAAATAKRESDRTAAAVSKAADAASKLSPAAAPAPTPLTQEQMQVRAAGAARAGEREEAAAEEEQRITDAEAKSAKVNEKPVRPTSKTQFRNKMFDLGIPIENRPGGPFGFPGREFTKEAYESQTGAKGVMAEVRGEMRQARGRMPQRALGTTMIQLAQNTLGNADEVNERIAKVEQGYATLGKMERDRAGLAGEGRELATQGAAKVATLDEQRALRSHAVQQRTAANLEGRKADAAEWSLEVDSLTGAIKNDEAAITEHEKKVTENKNSVNELDKNMGEFGESLKAQAKAAVGAKDIMRNLGAGFVGGIAGSITTMGVSAVVQGIMAAVPLAMPTIDKALGGGIAAQKVQQQQADVFMQGGMKGSAIPGSFAAMGFTSGEIDNIADVSTLQGEQIAGNRLYHERIQANANASALTGQQQQMGLPSDVAPGLFAQSGGISIDPRIVAGMLGPVVGTALMGATSILGIDKVEAFGEDSGAKLFAQEISRIKPNATISPQTDRGPIAAVGDWWGGGSPTITNDNEDIRSINERIKDSGATVSTGELDDETRALLKSVEGTINIIDELDKKGLKIEGLENIEQIYKLVQESTKPERDFGAFADVFMSGSGFNNQLWGMQEGFKLQDEQLRMNQGMNAMSNLPVQFGTGIAQRAGYQQPGGATSTSKLNTRGTQLDDAYMEGQAEALQDLHDIYGVSQEIVDEFKLLGQETKAWSVQIAEISAGQAERGFGIQMIKARQSMADLRGLMGKQGGSQIGMLERENVLLQRRGQLLQFEMQQRKLNFGIAMAGFQSIGLTGEERAANIRIAKKEAAIGQESLDIGKQTFGNQIQIFDKSNVRAFGNLARDISNMVKSFDENTKIAELQQMLGKANKRTEQLSQRIGTLLSQEMSLRQFENQVIAKLADDTDARLKLTPKWVAINEGMRQRINDLAKELKKAEEILEGLKENNSQDQNEGRYDPVTGEYTPASGDEGDQAGGSLTGGRKRIVVNINVAGHVVDAKQLAKIVERELGDQGALLGLNN
jgi:hypothetical protein